MDPPSSPSRPEFGSSETDFPPPSPFSELSKRGGRGDFQFELFSPPLPFQYGNLGMWARFEKEREGLKEGGQKLDAIYDLHLKMFPN